MKKFLLYILLMIIAAGNMHCVTNVFECREDMLEMESCPTREKKERDRLLFLIIFSNAGNGKTPPGLVR